MKILKLKEVVHKINFTAAKKKSASFWWSWNLSIVEKMMPGCGVSQKILLLFESYLSFTFSLVSKSKETWKQREWHLGLKLWVTGLIWFFGRIGSFHGNIQPYYFFTLT